MVALGWRGVSVWEQEISWWNEPSIASGRSPTECAASGDEASCVGHEDFNPRRMATEDEGSSRWYAVQSAIEKALVRPRLACPPRPEHDRREVELETAAGTLNKRWRDEQKLHDHSWPAHDPTMGSSVIERRSLDTVTGAPDSETLCSRKRFLAVDQPGECLAQSVVKVGVRP